MTTSARRLELIEPGHPGWEASYATYDLSAEHRPACVVRAHCAQDVVAAIALAVERGLAVAPQATGHGAASLPSLRHALLLRLDGLTDVRVDAAARTATFGAGATSRAVTAAAAAGGLRAVTGLAGMVGCTGFLLGGGVGWLTRRHGWAADAIVSALVVTPDGRERRVDAATEPELLFALRGGGAIGVVVETTVRLVAGGPVHGGELLWPVERAREVLGVWRAAVAEAGEDVTSLARVVALPDVEANPAALRGRRWAAVQSVHAGGDAVAHDAFLAPLRALGPVVDRVGMLDAAGLDRLHGDPERPVPILSDHLLLTDLDADAIDRFAAGTGEAGWPLVVAEIRHLGGALGRAGGSGPSACAPVAEPFALYAAGIAAGPGPATLTRSGLADLRAALAPWSTRRVLRNLTELGDVAEDVYAPDVLERLRAIRRRFDPDGLLVANLDLGG